MTHLERLALINRPFPVIRICYAVERWGGVFVNDNYGEGLHRADLIQASREYHAYRAPYGEYARKHEKETQLSSVEYAEWERVADNDDSI